MDLKHLEELIQVRLEQMLFSNSNWINYYNRYQEIIAAYNTEQDRVTIEKTFVYFIVGLIRSMDTEQ